MRSDQKPIRGDHGRGPPHASSAKRYRGWKLEDAKARFSELVRRAQSEGPQRVTVRGRDAVVVISAEELERLLPKEQHLPFVEFMESLYAEGLDLGREPDYGRDVEL
jgi:antitoxin Phd